VTTQKAHVTTQAQASTASPGSATTAEEAAQLRSGRLSRPNGLAWILPAMVVSVGLLYYCIGYTGYISTLSWDGASPLRRFVGLANYRRMLGDPVFRGALWHTVVFFIVTFVAEVILGIVFAALLHSRLYLRTLYKILIFVPAVLATTTTAPVFRVIYAQDGALNDVLQAVGLGAYAQPWIATGVFPLLIVISMQVWQSTGVVFVLYYAAMGQVEDEILEAARIDGASDLRILVSIVWPGVRGTTTAIAILTAIGSLKTFDIPFLVTSGGPNYTTEFLGTQIYRVSVSYSQVGYGAALSIVLLVLALGTALIINVGGRREKRADV